ncbi:MAG: MlaD family protein [Myxococcota bacterium]|nr:MlaD family protein [Myxococcota bacterium]
MGVTKAQKMRLGVFLVISGFALIGGLIVLAGARLGEKRDTYFVRYAEGQVSLNGLDVGSPVKYSGIRVGRVDRISIDPVDVSVIVVQLSLDENTPVARDSKANLGSMGITGLKYVDLSRGSQAAGIRQVGDDIPAGQSGLDALTNQAGEIASKVSLTLDRVNALIDPNFKRQVDGLLKRANELLATLEQTVAENRLPLKQLHVRLEETLRQGTATLASVGDVLRTIDGIAQENRQPIQTTLKNVETISRRLRDTRRKIDETLKAAEDLLSDGRASVGPNGIQATLKSLNQLLARGQSLLRANRANIVETTSYLRETSENMSDFSRRIREDPSLLLLGEGRD